jgi:carbonic anhydrase
MSEWNSGVEPAGITAHTEAESPAEALRLLLEGNHRFTTGQRLLPHQDADYRSALAKAQRPFAAIFGCSDSRLPAEIIFDQGLGDLFVVRTAGHVVGGEVLGSIEYAVAVLKTPLVAVLGHDSCGAVAAALTAVREGTAPEGFIREVVERVMLSALAVPEPAREDPRATVEEHIRYTAQLLVRRSAVIAEGVAAGRCGVVGLSYRLSEGTVRRVSSHGV